MNPLRIRLFYHSIISDWNNGHAHFLRGYVTELVRRGHDVVVYEPEDAWSVCNLIREQGGAKIIAQFRERFPGIRVRRYRTLELDEELLDADLVIVHEWNPPELVAAFGQMRAAGGAFQLLFHDTHHRAVTDPDGMSRYDLRFYDGVLAFGEVLRDIYMARGWSERAWTWHEAADIRTFHPQRNGMRPLDLIWIGNWGDDERTAEIHEFLIEPVRALRLRAVVHGVRYPDAAIEALNRAGIVYRGWLPNAGVAEAFSQARVTVHIPRRPYASRLRGIPTIRPFEAMACGIPLVSGPWEDSEGLFEAGRDYLVARNGGEMKQHLFDLLNNPTLAQRIAGQGLYAVTSRHTCSHRVDELLSIYDQLVAAPATAAAA